MFFYYYFFFSFLMVFCSDLINWVVSENEDKEPQNEVALAYAAALGYDETSCQMMVSGAGEEASNLQEQQSPSEPSTPIKEEIVDKCTLKVARPGMYLCALLFVFLFLFFSLTDIFCRSQ